MGAAQYVGRVGGLAVALGVGIGIFLGSGTASADTDSPSPSVSSSDTSTPSSAPSVRGADSQQPDADRDGSKTAQGSKDSDSEPSRQSDSGRTSSGKTDKPEPDSSDEASSDLAPADSDLANSEPADVDVTREESEDDGTTDMGQTTEDLTPVSTVSTKNAVSRLRTTAALEAPASQEQNPPAERVPAAAANREFGAAPTTYDPTVGLVDGVITGTNPQTAPNPLTYTVVRTPTTGGKVTLDTTTGSFSFLPYRLSSTPFTSEEFSVLVAEQTAVTDALQRVPVVNLLAPTVLVFLQQVPVVKDVLAPLIGRAEVTTVVIDVTSFVGQAPIAYTTTVASFDGTQISVNYFPAGGLGFDDRAPTILNGPSLATAGYTDPNQLSTVSGLVPGLSELRAAGYNVVTWDPRGEFASGGLLHLDSENFEARDVSAIINWVSQQPGTLLEAGTTDPLLGMVGGSYGGGIQLTSAGIDARIDAIAPGIAWNSLESALYPNNAFKTSWSSLLLLSLVVSGSRLDPEIYAGITTGILTGFLTQGQRDFLSENSPATVVGNITAPTLFLQGTVDGLFTLEQALDNAAALGGDVPVRMIWYCGGHGYCLDLSDDEKDAQTAYLIEETLAWMDVYVKHKGEVPPPSTGPTFVWVDQKGAWHSSERLPIDGAFYGESIEISGAGGVLPIVPILGGSGPQDLAPFPLSITTAADAWDALEVPMEPAPPGAPVRHIVGAPTIRFSYSGLGTSRHVYAQLVDNTTGRVVGNLVTPIPVRLDGRVHAVEVSMENIAYTMGPGDSLTLQIVDSATAYEDFTSFGIIRISGVGLTLPVAVNVADMALTPIAATGRGGFGTPSLEGLLTGMPSR